MQDDTKTSLSSGGLVPSEEVGPDRRIDLSEILDDRPRPAAPDALRIVIEEANEDGLFVASASRGRERFGFGTGHDPYSALDALVRAAREAAGLESARNTPLIEVVARLARKDV